MLATVARKRWEEGREEILEDRGPRESGAALKGFNLSIDGRNWSEATRQAYIQDRGRGTADKEASARSYRKAAIARAGVRDGSFWAGRRAGGFQYGSLSPTAFQKFPKLGCAAAWRSASPCTIPAPGHQQVQASGEVGIGMEKLGNKHHCGSLCLCSYRAHGASQCRHRGSVRHQRRLTASRRHFALISGRGLA